MRLPDEEGPSIELSSRSSSTVTAGLVRSTLPARSAATSPEGRASASTLRPTASAVAGESVATMSCIRNTSVHSCSPPKVSWRQIRRPASSRRCPDAR